jgi:hypothetical protein
MTFLREWVSGVFTLHKLPKLITLEGIMKRSTLLLVVSLSWERLHPAERKMVLAGAMPKPATLG